ncbi:hypothetical protein NEHOM01_0239 [Nematocida homosporus]|uniref:uncharacterized protein n=1 Tax=Nematocida homosporus TaxID=1912981 RepID=UPI00221EE8D9|nr:uncharacterized protein NEHOM01_0239 [Nematocida homosporus]KAI5184564.1 hypothetical protein NEHOM01_0239 [Nematocida homosporus]
MASEALKRRAKNNNKVLKSLLTKIVASNIVAFLFRFLFYKQAFSVIGITTFLLEVAMYVLIRKLSTYKVIKRSDKLEVVSEGADLSVRGAMHFLIDIVYISITAKLLSIIIHRKAWMIFLLIPASGYYEIFMRRDTRHRHK